MVKHVESCPWSLRSALRAAGLAGAALLTLTALPAPPARPRRRLGDARRPTATSAKAAAVTPKAGLSVHQSYGMQQGAVRGPGGRIWLIAMAPPQWQGNPGGSQALDAVNPTTGVVNYYAPLPPSVGSKTTLLAYDDGAPAFDGSGNAWMVATATTFSGARSHYLVRYAPGPSTSHSYLLPASCAAGGSPRGRRVSVGELREEQGHPGHRRRREPDVHPLPGLLGRPLRGRPERFHVGGRL